MLTTLAGSGERNPGFDTIQKVIRALGLKLQAEAFTPAGPASGQTEE
jgi:DNA-binding phage protein